MSWSKPSGALFALTAAISLTGCVQPVYNTLGEGVLEAELQAIKVEPIDDRFGYYVAKELMFAFNGAGAETPKKYRLVVKLKQRVQSPIVDTVTTRATAATVVGDAEYTLTRISDGMPITKGVAFSVAGYDRFAQRTANVRAARDAETRDAKTIAEQIKQQIQVSIIKKR